ncbi:MAG: hypothetical protein RIM99_10190 [Cyclobacteriaceae bacterium]
MNRFTGVFLVLTIQLSLGQSAKKLTIKGDYTLSDSVQMVSSYLLAKEAVEKMNMAMQAVWSVENEPGKSKRELRKEQWDASFSEWLGKPKRMGVVNRTINRIHSKFDKEVILEVTKENKGKCRGWISAWTIPFGKVRIRLCEDFFVYRTHLQEKVLVHEMGHEAGLLFHRRIHGCRAARRAAASNNGAARRSTENYAWLAMSYVGLNCSGR